VAPPARPSDHPNDRPDQGPPPTATQPLPDIGAGTTVGLPASITTTTPQPDLNRPARPVERGPGWADQYAPAGRSRWSGKAIVLVLCALLGTGLGVLAERYLVNRRAEPAATASASPSPVKATITSFDPSGGSGFRRDGSSWRSQSYASASFGNLKKGIGLVLDLGSARKLRAVSVGVDSGPINVQLRAADSSAATLDGWTQVGSPVPVSGTTALPADQGGSHRFWLVWVTSLASSGGGFSAVLHDPVPQA
jgi:hypothetical protein